MSRFVIKSADGAPPSADAGFAGVQPLADSGLFLAEAADPRATVKSADGIAWAAPALGDDGEESYPTGEVSVRFSSPLATDDLSGFMRRHSLDVLRQNEFIPEQVVVAPTEPSGTWLPDLVDRLNQEGVVDRAWPNTLSRYRRVE